MKAKHQRLTLLIVALAALAGAVGLALSALGDQATYFYAPGDVAEKGVEPGRAIRLGGMVQEGSIRRDPDGITYHFIVADNRATSAVVFKGVPPDLFREASGVVAEGRFDGSGRFIADNLLAKHDERYMPPEIAGAMHKTNSVE